MTRRRWRSPLHCALLVSLSACGPTFVPPEGLTNNGTNNEFQLGNIGDPCSGNEACSTGLTCDADGTCQAGGDLEEGSPCLRGAECADGLYCDQVAGQCLPAGEATAGEPCGATSDCQAGLTCAPRGFSGECVAPGEGDLGDECAGPTDCIAGLGCAPPLTDPTAPPICQSGLAGLPIWTGVQCAPDEEENFRSYFEIPDGEVTEFYRLPYPNDIRLKDGRPDLSGHPTPGEELLGFDVTQRYIDAVESSQDRFSPSAWMLMRFSERLDFDSIVVGTDSPSLYAVNLDPDHPDFGNRTSIRWSANTAAGNYICQNWLAVRPGRAWGRPLDFDTTYGVILTTDVKSAEGEAAAPDEDLVAMLSDSAPGGALGDAWEAYQPLRDWIAAEGIDADTIAQAVVYTTGNPIAEAQALAAPARETVPTVSDLTLCDAGVESPCDDGLEGDEHVRGCFEAESGHAEIHGTISLPIFQDGEAPYLESGGAVTPTVKRREDVCFAMTVPDAEMPAEGWPVIVYGHGTGGSFRSHVVNGALDIFNEIEVGGEPVKFLTIGWDQVMHHTRRNGDETHPNELVFNYANPAAAKGNFLQAAADVHAIMAYVEQLSIEAGDSPTSAEIRANPQQIYFVGHSQGGMSGPLALPFDTTSRGAVLSGVGAGLTLAILGKTTPIDSPRAVQAALLEPDVPSETHPVINIIQAYFDPVDPVNFSKYLVTDVIEGTTYPKHVFHTNSPTDTYSPPEGLNAMARGLGATYLLPMPEDIDGVPTAEGPFGGNVAHGDATYTSTGRQYEPDGYDGHFVMFRNSTAQGDVAEFLGTAVTAGVPEVE